MVTKATTTDDAKPEGGTSDAIPQAGDCVKDVVYGTGDPRDARSVLPGISVGLADALTAGVDSLARMQAEMARFGAGRMQRALETRSKMMGCRSIPEMQAVQAAYMREMVEDYAREWGRLLQFGLRADLGHPVPPPSASSPDRHATPV